MRRAAVCISLTSLLAQTCSGVARSSLDADVFVDNLLSRALAQAPLAESLRHTSAEAPCGDTGDTLEKAALAKPGPQLGPQTEREQSDPIRREAVRTTTAAPRQAKPLPAGIAMLAGGCAGMSADIALFPIDTLKTRCQAAEGFIKAGGYRRIYKGLRVAMLGSAFDDALFFATYESIKHHLRDAGEVHPLLAQMLAASMGEVAACVVRVPSELVKQRVQAGQFRRASETVRDIWKKGGLRGFYSGYSTSLITEIPFGLIQFPLWEHLKKELEAYQGRPTSPCQGACCGSMAGALAAALTTPLDLAKTRVMLGQGEAGGALATMRQAYRVGGVRGLYAGVVPRACWIGAAEFVFFLSYEIAVELFNKAEAQKQYAPQK